MEVYASGSFAEGDRLQSAEILAICAEYAAAVAGLSLLFRGADYVAAKESAICDMADREYDGRAEPTGGEFSIATGRSDILRRLREVSLDYTSGALKFARGQSPRAFAMRRKFDIVTHNMILSGGILILYADYMRPGGSAVFGAFADELRMCARGGFTPRDLPGELKAYSSIAVMGGFSSLPLTRSTVRRCAIFCHLRARF